MPNMIGRPECWTMEMIEDPRCGSGPKYRWRALPSTPPPRHLGPLPPHKTGPPRPGALQKEPRGVGGRGRERAGREGLWLEGRVLQLQWGVGVTLQTPVGARPTSGAPKMNGGSSAPYLACTPCVPLFCTLLDRGGNRRAFRLPGAGGDHFHCTVEPSPGHIRCRFWALKGSFCPGGKSHFEGTFWSSPASGAVAQRHLHKNLQGPGKKKAFTALLQCRTFLHAQYPKNLLRLFLPQKLFLFSEVSFKIPLKYPLKQV